MEFLLQWADDFDDAMGALRHLAPSIGGFLIALMLFAATGFALLAAPHTTLVVLAVLGSAVSLEVYRRRRLRVRTAAGD